MVTLVTVGNKRAQRGNYRVSAYSGVGPCGGAILSGFESAGYLGFLRAVVTYGCRQWTVSLGYLNLSEQLVTSQRFGEAPGRYSKWVCLILYIFADGASAVNDVQPSADIIAGEAAITDVDQQGDDADKKEEAVPEKLADDDDVKEVWYRRTFFAVFPKLRRGVPYVWFSSYTHV